LENSAPTSETLFVRNIGYETTQAKFKEFMEKFGEVKYALLCKVNSGEKAENGEAANKGTGFV
jgi:RNA recognition motif-containing protein